MNSVQNKIIAVAKDLSCEKLLFDAMSNLEKTNGLYYSFFKKYIFEFNKNDYKIQKKLKKAVKALQNCVRKHGEKKAISNLCLNLKIDNTRELSGDIIYFKLVELLKNS